MRVSLVRPRPADAVAPAAPLLAARGARVVLGGFGASADASASADAGAIEALAAPIAPRADSLFGPRGVCLADEALIVADTGHHRVLIWHRRPASDRTPADVVLGQPDFTREGRNARGEVSGATLDVPTGVAYGGGVLAVADAWNHRVLLWHGVPAVARPADVVLGQADARGALANRGGEPTAATLNWCYGVAILGDALVVADTGNRRVLWWDRIPDRDGAPADRVLGQATPVTRDENAGAAASAHGMRWPHGIAARGGALFVADAGNNRVMGWHAAPDRNGAPCDFVLGQPDMRGVDINAGAYDPTARTVNMPYGLAVADDTLIVADTANSRLLGFTAPGAATHLAGQARFVDKGDNRWRPVARDSLCWPYGVAARGALVAIADSGNNRVLLWERA